MVKGIQTSHQSPILKRNKLVGTAAMTRDVCDDTDAKGLLRAPEVAARLGVSVRALYDWVVENRLPAGIIFRAGRSVFLRRRALERWLEGQTDGPLLGAD